MFVKASNDFYSLRAVMNLVNPPPEKRRSVAPAMPPVKDKGNREITEKRFTVNTQPLRRPKAMPHEPAVPCHSCKPYRENLEAIKEDRAKPPTPHGWPISARARIFVDNHADPYGGHDQQNKQGRCSWGRSQTQTRIFSFPKDIYVRFLGEVSYGGMPTFDVIQARRPCLLDSARARCS